MQTAPRRLPIAIGVAALSLLLVYGVTSPSPFAIFSSAQDPPVVEKTLSTDSAGMTSVSDDRGSTPISHRREIDTRALHDDSSRGSLLAVKSDEPLSKNRFHGTLVFLDERGRSDEELDGMLSVEASRGLALKTPVQKGQWEIQIHDDSIRALRFAFSGQEVSILGSTDITPEQCPVTLIARAYPESLLHVVDEQTGEGLDGVDILRLRRWRDRLVHPDPQHLVDAWARDAISPIRIPGGQGRTRLRVRARGYAWRDIVVDLDQGAQRTVELSKACRLEVTVQGAPPQLPLEVRLYPGGFEGTDPAYVARPIPDDRSVTVFDNLTPGAYQLRVESGEWTAPPLVLARQEMSLQAGAQETVELTATLDLPTRRVPLSGTLELPESAAMHAPTLEIQRAYGPPLHPQDRQRIPLAAMRSLGEGRFAWEASDVTEGRVKLVVQPLQISTVLDLPAWGEKNALIRVPEVAKVHVTVSDADSNEKLPIEYVGWSKFEAGDWRQVDRETGSRAELALPFEWIRSHALGEATFYAPVGRIMVGVGLPGYEEVGQWKTLKPGINHLRFELAPLSILVLGFQFQGTFVPPPVGLEVTTVHDGTSWERWSDEGPRLLGIIHQPGTYLVQASPDAEFVFAPREVTLPEGARAQVDIEVHPRVR